METITFNDTSDYSGFFDAATELTSGEHAVVITDVCASGATFDGLPKTEDPPAIHGSVFNRCTIPGHLTSAIHECVFIRCTFPDGLPLVAGNCTFVGCTVPADADMANLWYTECTFVTTDLTEGWHPRTHPDDASLFEQCAFVDSPVAHPDDESISYTGCTEVSFRTR